MVWLCLVVTAAGQAEGLAPRPRDAGKSRPGGEHGGAIPSVSMVAAGDSPGRQATWSHRPFGGADAGSAGDRNIVFAPERAFLAHSPSTLPHST